MAFRGNAKGPNAVRVFFSNNKGLWCYPREGCPQIPNEPIDDTCGKGGWGPPYTQRIPGGGLDCDCGGGFVPEDDPINPPYGTAYCNYTPSDDDLQTRARIYWRDNGTVVDSRRGKQWPNKNVTGGAGSVNSPYAVDWRGLESSPGAGDMPILNIGVNNNAACRYIDCVPQNSNFWGKDGRIIKGPWDTGSPGAPGQFVSCQGIAIYDQGGDEHYIGVWGTGDVQINEHQVWARRVSAPNDSHWWLVYSMSDALLEFGTGGSGDEGKYIYKDDTGGALPGHPYRGSWRCAWMFNAEGNRALNYQTLPQVWGDPVPARETTYNGLVRYEFEITNLDGDAQTADFTWLQKEVEAGSWGNENRSGSSTVFCEPFNCDQSCTTVADCGDGWTQVTCVEQEDKSTSYTDTFVLDDVVLAGDYVYPTNTIREFKGSKNYVSSGSANRTSYSESRWSACRFSCGSPCCWCADGPTKLFTLDVSESSNYSWNETVEFSLDGATWSIINRQDSGSYSYTRNRVQQYSNVPAVDCVCCPAPPGIVSDTESGSTGAIPATNLESIWGSAHGVRILGMDLRYNVAIFEVQRKNRNQAFTVTSGSGVVSVGTGWIDGDGPCGVGCDDPECYHPETLETLTIDTDAYDQASAGYPIRGWASWQGERTIVKFQNGAVTTWTDITKRTNRAGPLVYSAGHSCNPCWDDCACGTPPGAGGCEPGNSGGPYNTDNPIAPAIHFFSIPFQQTNEFLPARVYAGYGNSGFARLQVDRQGNIVYSLHREDVHGEFGEGHSGCYDGMYQAQLIDNYYENAPGNNFDSFDLVDNDSASICNRDDGSDEPLHLYWPFVVI